MSRSIPPMPSAERAPARPRPRRGSGVVRLASLLLFVVCTGAPGAIAQDDSNAAYWLHEYARVRHNSRSSAPASDEPHVVQRPTHLIPRAAPVRGFAREVPAETEPSTGAPAAGAPAEGTTTAAPGTPAPETGAPAAATTSANTVAAKPPGTFVVAVLGDSLGQMLAQGLSEAFADKPEVVVLRKARENTGLVRDDYFDWTKAARDLVADKVDVAVMMVGSNDRQQIRDGNTLADLHTPRWTELYTARVEAIADLFRDKKIPLIWVGLPIMKSDRLSADMAEFNEIYRDSASKSGATYVDTWEGFADDRGQYSAYGPDISGQFVKLRASDGVHFTKAGALTLAHFVEEDIRRDEQQAQPPLDSAVAALVPQAPAAAQPTAAVPGQQSSGGLAGVPVPAPPPAVVIPIEPAAGPIMPLNAPAISSDGQLATTTQGSAASGEAQALLDKALVEGRPLEAEPGRTDDFSWPRH